MSFSGSGDKASVNIVKDEIDELIKDHKVMVFSKTTCPFCIKAKRVLAKYKIKNYKIIELDNMKNGDEYQKILGQMTGARTVPRVFIDGECIGGGDETEYLERRGELEKKLIKANALEN